MHLQAADTSKPASILTLALLLALPACASAARITVDTTSVADLDDAACSLYEAIVAANSDAAYHGCDAGAGADEIDFDLPPASVIGGTLFALPTLTTSMTFIGPGAEDLTIDGAGLQPLFLIDSPSGGELVEFRDLTLARGNAFVFSFNRGGAITVVDGDRASMRRMVFRANHSELAGGAVLVTTAPGSNRATALVEDCHFEANEADLAGGGAVYAQRSRLDISRSTFAFNSTEAEPANAQPWGGGAVHARDSQLTVDRSTFIGNYTFGVGGAILVSSIEPETMDVFGLFDSTLYENVADGDGDDLGGAGGLALVGFPGDLHSTFVNNNAIAENVDPGTVSWPDIYATGLGFTAATTNLIGINTDMEFQFPAGDPNADINYVGDAASPMRARFLAFSNYGGPTPVLMPSPIGSSRLIDRGLCQLPAGDQRGYLNPQSAQRAVDSATFPNGPGSDGCDIGAVETEAAATPNAEIFVDGFE